jgi:serine-type D-Ala-D-Ala carboxypeptidase
VGLQTPVSAHLPAFSGQRTIQGYPNSLRPFEVIEVSPATTVQVDASGVTYADLLVHDSGLPAWWPLFAAPSLAERRSLAQELPFAYVPHTQVVYSDIGLILVGMALEVLANKPLDQIVAERVAEPLGLRSLSYSPVACNDVGLTRTVYDPESVLCGVVHDDNARGFGGVAGHAGLFANVHDVAEFGEAMRRGGAPVLHAATVDDMTRLHAQDGATRRGIGFALWSPDPEASSHPLSPQTYGHTGFTGTSLWIDPQRKLVVAVLTNRVYYGNITADAMARFRVRLHAAICAAVD